MTAPRHNTGTSSTVAGSIFVYDELPKHIRQKLANANHNWSPEETRETLFWEGASYFTAQLKAGEEALAEQHYAILASGKPYPRESQ